MSKNILKITAVLLTVILAIGVVGTIVKSVNADEELTKTNATEVTTEFVEESTEHIIDDEYDNEMDAEDSSEVTIDTEVEENTEYIENISEPDITKLDVFLGEDSDFEYYLVYDIEVNEDEGYCVNETCKHCHYGANYKTTKAEIKERFNVTIDDEFIQSNCK